MPELPEVETTRRGIEPHVGRPPDRRAAPSTSRDCAGACRTTCRGLVAGQRILHARRRAKYLLLELESGTLMLHLGMSGSLRVLPADTPRLTHDHFDLVLDSGITLRFNDPRRFGSLHYTTGDPDEHPLLADLAPEPLDAAFNADYLWRITRGRRVAIKQLLMNSQLVVGVGNIYASEALFRAKVRPRRQARNLTRVEVDPTRARGEGRSGDGHSCRWHDAARLRRRGWPARLFQAEAVCLRTQLTTVPKVPHAGAAAHPGAALDLLLPNLPEVASGAAVFLQLRFDYGMHELRYIPAQDRDFPDQGR